MAYSRDLPSRRRTCCGVTISVMMLFVPIIMMFKYEAGTVVASVYPPLDKTDVGMVEQTSSVPDSSGQSGTDNPNLLQIKDFSGRTPFILAFCIFFLQFCCGCLSLIVLCIRSSPSTDQKAIRDSMSAYVLISMGEMLMYGMLSVRSDIETSMWTLSFVDGRPYLIVRNWAWLFFTPTQWYCFTKCCSHATALDRRKLIGYTILMQIFGILCMYTKEPTVAWTHFVVSCVFFCLMFAAAFGIKIDRKKDGLGGALLALDLCLWLAYPCLLVLRMVGFCSLWNEQVLAYTAFDVSAKTVSFSGIIAAQLLNVLHNIESRGRTDSSD